MTPDLPDDPAELLAIFLDESGYTEREYTYTKAHDTVAEYVALHPEAAGMQPATIKALASLKQHCPPALRERVWPA